MAIPQGLERRQILVKGRNKERIMTMAWCDRKSWEESAVDSTKNGLKGL